MKTKIGLSLLMGAMFLMGQIPVASAQSLIMTANLPKATSFNLTTSSVNKTPGCTGAACWIALTGTGGQTLDFGDLGLVKNTDGTTFYGPANGYYYAVDLSPNIGVGSPAIAFSFSDTGINKGFGDRAGVTLVKTTTSGSSTSDTAVGSATLTNAATISVSAANGTATFKGGWARIYIGTCTGNTNVAKGPVDPTGCKPFSASDVGGQYGGTLILTVTAAT